MTTSPDPHAKSPYRLDIDGELPLTTLIQTKLESLGLTKVALAQRMGYTSTPEKGIRRLDSLLAGDLKKYKNIKGPLAKALEVEESVLDQVVADTRYVFWARDDRAYRRDFRPHVVWNTEFRIPRPIAIAGVVGANRLLYYYPVSPRPQDWSEEAVENRPRGIPCYGLVFGFWVNYSPDCSVEFTEDGEPESVFGQAVRPGVPSAAFGSRPTNWAEVTKSRNENLDKIDWSSY